MVHYMAYPLTYSTLNVVLLNVALFEKEMNNIFSLLPKIHAFALPSNSKSIQIVCKAKEEAESRAEARTTIASTIDKEQDSYG